MTIRLKRGLDLPISGQPEQKIYDAAPVGSVAVMGFDYIGMKPTMYVQEGDKIELGQALFSDKKNPDVTYTSPACGVVHKINRGAKRVMQSVVIQLDGEGERTFDEYAPNKLAQLTPRQIKDNLTKSGMWASMRTRPYSKQPKPSTNVTAIFINAMDTRPLAADPAVIIKEYADDFKHGVVVLSRLTEGTLYICHTDGADIPQVDLSNTVYQAFSGPHPAGLPGTHIHFLDPVSNTKTVWHLNYQEVIAIGKLFTTGRLWTDRVIALGGPMVKNPRLLRTRLGASTNDLIKDELHSGEARVISGSVLSGRRAADWAAYVGRFHLQVAVVREGREREFLGWIKPGKNKFSAMRVFLSSFNRGRLFDLTTSTNGSPRAMVPIGNYEKVMPLDILPTQLLRALLTRDTDLAQALGCLELDEEDLALCSFVSHAKYDYGPVLRANLTQIEQEG